MKQYIIMAILKLCGKAILIAGIVAAAIMYIGYTKEWDTALAYSNAFFIAGCLVIIAGGASRLGDQDWSSLQLLPAESFRGMSNDERALYIVNMSNSFSRVLLGLLSGSLLIFVSVMITKLFPVGA